MKSVRILVALDASRESLAALSAAASLASRMKAELRALFVEDIGMIRLAGYSFTRELGAQSATPRPLDTRAVERALRRMADEAREAMIAEAERLGVSWSFSVTRGVVTGELLAAADEADLVALGVSSRRAGPRRRLGSTARSVLARSSRSVLLLQGGSPIEGPAVLVLDEGADSAPLLAHAARLADACGGETIALIAASDPDAASRVRAAAAAALARTVSRGGAPRLREIRPEALLRTVRELHPGVVILAGSICLSGEEPILDLVERLGRPVLLVR